MRFCWYQRITYPKKCLRFNNLGFLLIFLCLIWYFGNTRPADQPITKPTMAPPIAKKTIHQDHKPKTGKFMPVITKMTDGPKTPATPVNLVSVETEDGIYEELSPDNHPIDNIMILKRRLVNGRIKKQRTESKLGDWKREAMTKFGKETKDGEGNVIMRDLIFFRPTK